MTNMGTPIRRRMSVEELLRTTLNKILEDEIKEQGVKTPRPFTIATIYESVTMSHAEPTVTTTTSVTDTYDSATAIYESSEYA